MRVLILSQYFPPDMGGGATRAYNLAKGLSSFGCEVTVITAFPHYPTGNIPKKYRTRLIAYEQESNFKVIRTFVPPVASEGFKKRIFLFLSFVFSSLFATFKIKKPDIIFASNPNVISVFPSIAYSKIYGAPVIQNVDDLWPEVMYDLGMPHDSFLGKFASFLAGITYNYSAVITPISYGYVQTLSQKYNIDLKKIIVIRGGVDINRFKANPNTSKNKRLKILYSGAFSTAYDFEQVLLAAKQLENVKDIEFVLQGAGELLDFVKKRINELRINNVLVINKVYSRDEVATLLNNSDVLLLPLKDFGVPYLGMSSKLYEYQAVGKPIICCCAGEPANYIRKTSSGIVTRPGDYNDLAKAVLFLKNNSQLATRMGLSGKVYVENNLSIERIAQAMLSTFKFALNQRSQIALSARLSKKTLLESKLTLQDGLA